MVRLKPEEIEILSKRDKKEYRNYGYRHSSSFWLVGILSTMWFIGNIFFMLVYLCLKDFMSILDRAVFLVGLADFSCSALGGILMLLVFTIFLEVGWFVSCDINQTRFLKKKGYDIKFKELELNKLKNKNKK